MSTNYLPEIEGLDALRRFRAGETPERIAKSMSAEGRQFLGWPEQEPLRKAPPPVLSDPVPSLAAARRRERGASRQFEELRKSLDVLAKSMSNRRNARERQVAQRAVALYGELRRDLQRDAKSGTSPRESIAAREAALTAIATRMHSARLL